MPIIGRIDVSPAPGQQALEAVPEMVLTLEDIRANPDEPWRFLYWASGDAFDRFETALSSDPTISTFKCVTDLHDKRLYRLVLSETGQERTPHPVTIELDITIIDLTITRSGEEVLLRFPSRDALWTYRDACRERGRNFELRTLYEEKPTDSRDTVEARFGVTPSQREAMLTALELGYFRVPRDTTMDRIADELDISTSALSTRLRRGQRALIRNTLVEKTTI